MRQPMKPKWQKKLTRAEVKHIAETCFDNVPTLRGFRANREFHRHEIKRGQNDPCQLCRHIAIKLGLE